MRKLILTFHYFIKAFALMMACFISCSSPRQVACHEISRYPEGYHALKRNHSNINKNKSFATTKSWSHSWILRQTKDPILLRDNKSFPQDIRGNNGLIATREIENKTPADDYGVIASVNSSFPIGTEKLYLPLAKLPDYQQYKQIQPVKSIAADVSLTDIRSAGKEIHKIIKTAGKEIDERKSLSNQDIDLKDVKPAKNLAVWSFILGLLGIIGVMTVSISASMALFFLGILAGMAALPLGIIALTRTRKHQQMEGSVLAIAGIVLGGLTIVLAIVTAIVALFIFIFVITLGF